MSKLSPKSMGMVVRQAEFFRRIGTNSRFSSRANSRKRSRTSTGTANAMQMSGPDEWVHAAHVGWVPTLFPPDAGQLLRRERRRCGTGSSISSKRREGRSGWMIGSKRSLARFSVFFVKKKEWRCSVKPRLQSPVPNAIKIRV